ncbi:mCG1046012, partial [Mus musculus]
QIQDSSCIFYFSCHFNPVTIRFQWVSGFCVVDDGRKVKSIEKFEQVSPSYVHILSDGSILLLLVHGPKIQVGVIRWSEMSALSTTFTVLFFFFFLRVKLPFASQPRRYFFSLISSPRYKSPP